MYYYYLEYQYIENEMLVTLVYESLLLKRKYMYLLLMYAYLFDLDNGTLCIFI